MSGPAGVARDMASSIPADTLLLAGLDLDALRASPLYPKLPPAVRALAEPLRDAEYLLLASNGKDLLSIARGRFREAPPGATLVAPGLVAAGPSDSVRAAIAQHQTGRGGAPDLLIRAASLADGKQIWMVARGGVPLPAAGNAANLNRLLRDTEYTAIAARIDSGIEIEATSVGRTAEAGREARREPARHSLSHRRGRCAPAGSGGADSLYPNQPRRSQRARGPFRWSGRGRKPPPPHSVTDTRVLVLHESAPRGARIHTHLRV